MYTREGNHVALSVYKDGGMIHVTVADKGAGISGDLMGRVFRPYASYPLLGKAAGVGLGLTIAKWLTAAQGGALLLESEEGYGTTVTFSFPDQSFSRVLTLEQGNDQPYPLNDKFSDLYIGLVGVLDEPYKFIDNN